MLDTIISSLLAICAGLLAYLGLRVTLHAPSDLDKTKYKLAFGLLAVLNILLVIWQGVRSSETQAELTGNVGIVKKDLISEIARREQAEKDFQFIITGKIEDATKTLSGSIDKVKPIPNIPPSLAFTFPVRHSDEVPITVSHLRIESGYAHVLFTVKNISAASAKNPEFWLRICDACKFAKEPEGFENLSGVGFNPNIRHRAVPMTMNSGVFLPMMAVDIIPPSPSSEFEISFNYACENCGKTNWRKFKVILDL